MNSELDILFQLYLMFYPFFVTSTVDLLLFIHASCLHDGNRLGRLSDCGRTYWNKNLHQRICGLWKIIGIYRKQGNRRRTYIIGKPFIVIESWKLYPTLRMAATSYRVTTVHASISCTLAHMFTWIETVHLFYCGIQCSKNRGTFVSLFSFSS